LQLDYSVKSFIDRNDPCNPFRLSDVFKLNYVMNITRMANPVVAAKHVLVIDDNEHIQQIVQAALQRLTTWTISVASSAKEGLAKAEAERPDVILMDYMMPEMNGVDCLKQLRLNPETEAIPVLFLTAYQSLVEPRRFQAMGAAGAIAKPFDPFFIAPHIIQTLGWDTEEP
jgi:CheY-like chemotaxis protein